MLNKFKQLSIILTALLISACAQHSQRVALTEANKQHIKSNHIFVNKTQPNIAKKHAAALQADMPDPLAPMGSMTSARNNVTSEKGLIGNLIVKSLESQNGSHLNKQIKLSMAKFPWLHVNKKRARYTINQQSFTVTTKDHENTTLFINTSYNINPNFTHLNVAANVKLVQMSIGNNEEVVLYQNNFYVVNRLPRSKYLDAKDWSQKNRTLLKQTLRASGSELAKMITLDLQNPTEHVYRTDSKQIAFTSFNGTKDTGHYIKQDKGYYILGGNNQALYAISRGDIIH